MTITNLSTINHRLSNLQALNERFAITEHLEFKVERAGFPVVEIQNHFAEATIALQGGYIMTFRPRDRYPVLWLSPFAPMNEAKPIRGGIPVCWPWFGPHATDPNQPAHGFARTSAWKVLETKMTEVGDTQILLELENQENSQSLQLQQQITVGNALQVELITRNMGTETFNLTEALHTYFNVSDVSQVAIHGLENGQYIDKVDNSQSKVQEGPIKISSETDRVYFNTTATCIIEDPGFKRRIRIAKVGSQSTVVWNPWIEKAAQLGDLGYQGYLKMLCIETANALENSVIVAPNTEHRLIMMVEVEL